MRRHSLSHHGQDEAKISQLKKIGLDIVEAFGDLLAQLSERTDPNGSLIDQATVLFGSNLGNPNAHTTHDLPILVAGGGYLHGKHIMHKGDENAPLCNLFVTMLQSMGVETESNVAMCFRMVECAVPRCNPNCKLDGARRNTSLVNFKGEEPDAQVCDRT